MTNVTRWDPFQDLRQTMDRLFDDGYARPWRFLTTDDALRLPVDIAETENEIDIKAEMPGMNPNEVEITIQDDALVIRGEHREETEDNKKDYRRREIRYGSFHRSIPLPSRVDAEHATADFNNGVLHLRLPRSESAKPKQIKVNTGNGGSHI